MGMVDRKLHRVLVYGAGVVGSVYAARIWQAGFDTGILARGDRLRDLRDHGIVLQDRRSAKLTVAPVPPVASLASDAGYDLAIIAVRRNQVEEILPVLSAAKGIRTFCFLVNTAAGYRSWNNAIGGDRLLPGFPGVAGIRQGPVVRYTLLPAWLQPTTIAEPDGRRTPRLDAVCGLFQAAGFPTAIARDMLSWLMCHVAVVSPLANAVYRSQGNAMSLAGSRPAIRLVVEAIREGLRVVRQLGMAVAPGKLRLFEALPAPLLVSLFRWWIGSNHFQLVAGSHAAAAQTKCCTWHANSTSSFKNPTPAHRPSMSYSRRARRSTRAGNRHGANGVQHAGFPVELMRTAESHLRM